MMQTNDFKGQDLRGKSFKNQDLTGADFSDCDLRGVDFSYSNLSDAKFCNARMGRPKIIGFILWLLQLVLSIATITITTIASVMLIGILGIEDKNWLISGLLLVGIHMLLAVAFLFSSLRQRWSYLFAGFGFSTKILIVKAVVKINLISKVDNYNLVEAMVNADAISGILLEIGTTIGISIGALVGISIGILIESESIKTYKNITKSIINTIVSGIFIGIIFMQLLSFMYFNLGHKEVFSFDVIFPVFIGSISIGMFSLGYILLGIYLGKRANNREEFQLLWLHNFSLKIACFGSTKFTFSTLNNADFSRVDFKKANFKNAKISNCNFKNATNHHLALTENTPLEPRKVRDLVIDGIITDKNFATLDLRGLDFSHLNLEGFDFSHANLSGANLSHCQLTGAILEGWNIDTETNLEGVDCRYYYFEKIKDDDSEEEKNKKRMPPKDEKEYEPGEFTTIFQHLAKTVNIIAHNPVELAAIKLSIEQVSKERENDGIRLQSLEVKNGQIVVGIAVPKTEDAGVLHHALSEMMQQNLEKNGHLLNNTLAKGLEKLFVEIQKLNTGDTVMGDKITTNVTNSTVHGSIITAKSVENSRHQSFDGTASNANINFGDNARLTNTAQVIDNKNEFKDLL